ncbi:MAG: hypothetical protein MJ252_02705 [archaeon]|nr:hypothetical protein [archaeon]
MEAIFDNLQDNLVFHANIFNYDKNLFTELVSKKLKLTFTEYQISKHTALEVDEELNSVIAFLTSKSTIQNEQLRTLNYEIEGNLDYLHKDKANELQISEEAHRTISTILDLLSFSFTKYCEDEELIRQNQQEVAQSLDAQKLELSNSVYYDNLLCCLLYLDGICMANIELIKNINLMSIKSFGKDLFDFLFEIISCKLLKFYPKEISSHLLCMLMMQSEGDVSEKSKKLLDWTFQHYLENKRDNCLTSNCCLLLTNDECVDYFTGQFNEEKQCIRILFDLMLKESNVNIIYESLFCIWNISNNKNYFYLFEKTNDNYIETIIQTIRTNKIDKIARIGLLTIKNLLGSQPCIEILFNQKFMRTIDILLTNKWNDVRIKNNFNFRLLLRNF